MSTDTDNTHLGFKITCDECGSSGVYVDSDFGCSDTSGTWGGVSLQCDKCENEIKIWQAY